MDKPTPGASLSNRLWTPEAERISASNVSALMRKLGVASYEDLLRFSVERPGDYWRVVLDLCQIVWDHPYERYLDSSRGIEFPRWFTGGRLNWVNSVLAWADRPGMAGR